jgi:hypothetical protein
VEQRIWAAEGGRVGELTGGPRHGGEGRGAFSEGGEAGRIWPVALEADEVGGAGSIRVRDDD